MRVIILGSGGYTGQMLLRLLLHHPDVSGIVAVSTSRAGQRVVLARESGDYSGKLDVGGGVYQPMEKLEQWGGDVLFSALPHLRSVDAWRDLVGKLVVIDLAADMRLQGGDLFRSLYGVDMPDAGLTGRAVYGLSEIYGDKIASADLIANPGCFPTAILLPLLPLAYEGVIGSEVVCTAITGTSGGGGAGNPVFLLSERIESSGAYKPGRSHRHWGELSEQLPGHSVSFTPHLAPLSRGITATIVTRLRSGAGEKDLHYSYHQYYQGRAFVRFLADTLPQSGDVRGSNCCAFSWRLEEDGQLLLFSAIDNLIKGASGQAVQNMNLRFGLAETSGLPVNSEL